MKHDFSYLRELVAFMKEEGLCEMEVGEGAEKVRMQLPVAGMAALPAPLAAMGGHVQQFVQPGQPDSAKITEIPNGQILKSPMVGTFYTAASPDTAPFVKIGDTVEKGQVICIIEAMKTMNQIEAEESGTVTEVLAKNAQPVEYGEPLFRIG